MLTCPITTDHFHSRVLSLLSASLAQPQSSNHSTLSSGSFLSTSISQLSPLDTPLTPDQSTSQIIATTSSWIDLGSPDPIIADLSRQILKLELTYAAFCGITYVLIAAPRSHRGGLSDNGLIQYARTILDALQHGPYMQIHIWVPMIEHVKSEDDLIGDLAPFARQEYQIEDMHDTKKLDIFGSWAAWNVIRSMCKYHSRLCVGKLDNDTFITFCCFPPFQHSSAELTFAIALSLPKFLPPVPIQSRWYSEPVRIFTLHADIFSKNAKGYPVLSKPHQALVSRFTKLRNPPWFLLCEVGSLPWKQLTTVEDGSETTVLPMDSNQFPSLAEAQTTPNKDPTPHLSYLRNLQRKQPSQSQMERFGAGYQDYLQAPLQPLTVNLESITYEVFEKDPIKYDWYERATARALHDWIEQGKPTSGPDGRVVVAVVGAGRGPLVTRALRASEDVDVEIDMWALEKNPNAFVLLQRHNEMIWNNRVSLVKSDMRTWRGPYHIPEPTNPARTDQEGTIAQAVSSTVEGKGTTTAYTGDLEVDKDWLLATTQNTPTHYKVDILISELLGSFADNELSPECLDGVQHLINPVHGISIPASYTAHLTPIAAPKLHADIQNQSISNTNAPETPYVVMLHAIDHLSTQAADDKSLTWATYSTPSNPQNAPSTPSVAAAPAAIIKTAWSFQHPNPFLPSTTSPLSPTAPPQILTNTHNNRSCSLTFPIPNRGTCHGLAGYFETVLYDSRPSKVELSTNPVTMSSKSNGMISWFPIYFPLKVRRSTLPRLFGTMLMESP
jgi:protein arginine N-methyltransferase 5